MSDWNGHGEVDWKQHRGEARLDPRLRQLRIRNLLGHTFSVYVDLREDVTRLNQLFALREGLPKSSHVMASLRFVFDGIVLEPDVPLVEYGIMQGSMLQTRICPRAWRGDAASECSSEEGREVHEPIKERRSVWIKVPLTVVTPFGEAKGALEIPEPYWPMCRLAPKTLNSIYCLTDHIGVNGAFAPGRGIYWQLRLDGYMPYPCMQNSNITDVWKRLSSTFAQVEVEAPSSCQLPRRHLVNEDDTLSFASLDASAASEMHLKISLLSDNERTVSDSTAMFRETEASERKDEHCCICLEPMQSGEWCRRLPCMHRMHAGCCMLHLPTNLLVQSAEQVSSPHRQCRLCQLCHRRPNTEARHRTGEVGFGRRRCPALRHCQACHDLAAPPGRATRAQVRCLVHPIRLHPLCPRSGTFLLERTIRARPFHD